MFAIRCFRFWLIQALWRGCLEKRVGRVPVSNVFISSVVGGFEEYRAAAGKAVGMLGHQPVMSEAFGARTYSSDIACITEVKNCDVYILILGATYGYVPEGDDVSVTHAEYRAAMEASRPILVFVQDVKMEQAQHAFKQEVEGYYTGQFRESFSTPEELKDGIVQALSLWQRSNDAIPAERFGELFDEALLECGDASTRNSYEPKVIFGFLPQPFVPEDLSAIEGDLDQFFARLCTGGFGQLRDGYRACSGQEWSGLTSGTLQYVVFENGLRLLGTSLTRDGASTLGYFLSPDTLRSASRAFLNLLPTGSGFLVIRLNQMDQAFISENPGGNSIQMRGFFGGEDGFSASNYFNPLSEGAFEIWLDRTMNSIQRRYGYPPRSL